NHTFFRGAPQIHRCIRAPGSPSFGATLELAGTVELQTPKKSEVARWKRIRLSESTHGDVLCRPISDPGDFAQPREQLFGISDPVKADLPTTNRASQCANGCSARLRKSDGGQIRFRQNRRRRENV